MGMVTYDRLNGASARSCKNRPVNSVCPGKVLRVRLSLVHEYTRSSSGLFRVHINAKSVNQFPAGKHGKRILKRNAVKMML